MLFEIRWHGRAGQGIITASYILAHAAVLEGKHAQAFPEFGPERLGAPISGFTRISEQPIQIHSQVYNPNAVLVLDDSLIRIIDVGRGLKSDGFVFVNTKRNGEGIAGELKLEGGMVFSVDADGISNDVMGKPTPNTAMIGALIAVKPVVNLGSIIAAIEKRFSGLAVERNTALVRKTFDLMNGRLEMVKA